MQLNIGSGPDYRDGFINTERFVHSTHHKGETVTPDVISDAHKLPFKDASFDHVRIAHVLEHLYRPMDALDEIYRVCKPEATVHIEVPNASVVNHERGDHMYSWTKWTLHNILRHCGFSIDSFKQEGNSNGPSQIAVCSINER